MYVWWYGPICSFWKWITRTFMETTKQFKILSRRMSVWQDLLPVGQVNLLHIYWHLCPLRGYIMALLTFYFYLFDGTEVIEIHESPFWKGFRSQMDLAIAVLYGAKAIAYLYGAKVGARRFLNKRLQIHRSLISVARSAVTDTTHYHPRGPHIDLQSFRHPVILRSDHGCGATTFLCQT